ncbi:MAG TPA: Ig-like domain-containing protein, partial [Tepidisphaeraceae bacterium]|nr:Ig-like domain-containing protein [Tepidisphaeraceae bacterium]
SGQTLSFQVTTDNDALFSVPPTIDPATGTLTYTPAADATGTATVTVTLSDDGGTANGGANTSASQTFTITVNALNHAPVVQNMLRVSRPGASSTFNVLRKVSDTDGDSLSIGDVTIDPMYGTATVNDNGTPADTTDDYIVYVPNAGSYADDYFQYTVSDGQGGLTIGWASVRNQGAGLVAGAGGKTNLVVVGTSGADTITLLRHRKGVRVMYNGVEAGVFNPTGRIMVEGGAGSDTLDGSRMLRSVELYGGHGNDVLIGTSYNDVFSGSGGTNTIRLRGGQDNILKRSGRDQVFAW